MTERIDDDIIENAEHHGGRADAESQSKDGDQGETTILRQAT
jgi:hypothetical protein